MAKKRRKQNKGLDFRLGEPEQVLSGNLISMLGSVLNTMNGYYQPPIDMAGLSRMTHANAHHSACIRFRVNMLCRFFQPNVWLSMQDFRASALDFLVFGMAHYQTRNNYLGRPVRLQHLPGLNMRRMPDTDDGLEQYLMLHPGGMDKTTFQPGEVIRAAEYDTNQQIYGVPDWLGGLQSVLLNEDATLFRRRYYQNGSHLGYILYTSDPAIEPEVEKQLREKVAQGKGVGNFRSLYINIPGGKSDSVKIIPIGDISQKDEFDRIKNISAEDIIVAHRVRGELAAVLPREAGGSGDIEKISRVYVENEVRPLAAVFESLNFNFENITPFQFSFPSDTN